MSEKLQLMLFLFVVVAFLLLAFVLLIWPIILAYRASADPANVGDENLPSDELSICDTEFWRRFRQWRAARKGRK